MEKWEYTKLSGFTPISMINSMGYNGWEMCGVYNLEGITPTYYFKRKIQTEPLKNN